MVEVCEKAGTPTMGSGTVIGVFNWGNATRSAEADDAVDGGGGGKTVGMSDTRFCDERVGFWLSSVASNTCKAVLEENLSKMTCSAGGTILTVVSTYVSPQKRTVTTQNKGSNT
eukprot:RCo027761